MGRLVIPLIIALNMIDFSKMLPNLTQALG
jgi:hypothetical protein